MTRSRKKHAYEWVSKTWTKLHQSGFRRRVKQACHKAEVADFEFDPDRDWEEAYLEEKKLGDWGTKCGWDVKPSPDDSVSDIENYEKMLRKK